MITESWWWRTDEWLHVHAAWCKWLWQPYCDWVDRRVGGVN